MKLDDVKQIMRYYIRNTGSLFTSRDLVCVSGTPSDLLPLELGQCDYEESDDGMMISTVVDRKTASYEFVENDWTVELVLKKIATSENPRVNALIDTGALITGHSNKEVFFTLCMSKVRVLGLPDACRLPKSFSSWA